MDKVGLVTGASGTLGSAIAQTIALDLNHHVLLHYNKNNASATDCLHKIMDKGGSAELISFDVSDQESVNSAIGKWEKDNSSRAIEVLVNNAGVNKDTLFAWMEKQDWDNVINTSLHGFYHVTKLILPMMMKMKYGRIINITSMSGLFGNPGQVNYAAAKAGLIGATKSLAKEVARMGITVNAIAPGYIESDMTADLDIDQLKHLIPMRRFGKPEEVASAVLFLGGKDSGYISGEVININGGVF